MQQNEMKNKFYLIWSLLTAFTLIITFFLSNGNEPFTRIVVMTGTLIVAIIMLVSYMISVRNLLDSNPNRFVRGIMGGTFLKFMLSIVAVSILLFSVRDKLHKPDLFLLMGVYLLFSMVETAFLSIVSRKN
jgi:hypothetical protein